MKEEDSNNEVEYLFEVKSTYKTRREGILKRRQLKLEMEMKAKENRLRLADYRPRDGYMQWQDLLALYGPMETDDEDEDDDKDMEDARAAEECDKEAEDPTNGIN